MIYFDNAATTLPKPPSVAEAVARAIQTFGNPGRSFTEPSMAASRAVLNARAAVAELLGLADPARVAFTSGCTESLSLIANTLSPADHVVMDESAHNAALRPFKRSGCELDILPCDAFGRLRTDKLAAMIRPSTRYVCVTHGSNLTGNLTDLTPIRALCAARAIPLIIDAAQTVGHLPLTCGAGEILCFSGHKGLFGPMGVGGLAVGEAVALPILKTGGTGSDTFAWLQPDAMPDLAEAGTPNAHGLAGLLAGIAYVRSIGLPKIAAHESALAHRLADGLSAIPGARVYGDFSEKPRLGVVSFRLEDMDSAETALRLWEDFGIATRAGGHCAPLLHKRLGTDATGLVRCSLSWMNTSDEVDICLRAVRALAAERAHG